MQKINSKLVFIALWILLLSTTFVVCPWLWNPTETGKYFYFALAVTFALPITGLIFFASRSVFRISITDIAVFCFTLWVLVRGAFGGMRPGMELWVFWLLLPLFVTIRITLLGEGSAVAERVRLLLLVIVSAAIVEAIWGFLQLYGNAKSYNGIFAISGSFFNPAPYSCFLACAVPPALYFIAKGRSRVEKILGLTCAISSATILPATMSRAAWIAVLVGCLFVAYGLCCFNSALARLRESKIFKWLLAAACAILVALFFTGAYFIKKESADGRIFIWRTSTTLIRDNPLAGSGFGSFQSLYCGAQASYFLTSKATEEEQQVAGIPDYAFNEYLQLTVEHGIVGLLLFLFIIYSFFSKRGSGGCNDSIGFGVKGSLIAFLIFAFFSYPFSIPALSLLFVTLAATSASLSPSIKQFSRRWVGLAVIILCLGLTVYSTTQLFSRYAAFREWSLAQRHYHAGEWRQAEAKYRRLYSKLNFQKHFLFEYALCLSETGQYKASNEVLLNFLYFGSDPMVYSSMGDNYKNMKEYEKAENMYLLAFRIVPNRHYPLYLLMKLYYDSGATKMAKTMAELLLEKPAKVASKAIEEMREEAKKILELQAAN